MHGDGGGWPGDRRRPTDAWRPTADRGKGPTKSGEQHVPAPANERADERYQETHECDDRERHGMLAAHDVEPGQRMGRRDRFEVLLHDERHCCPGRDRQPKASREPSEQSEASVIDAQSTGSDQGGLPNEATKLADSNDRECHSDTGDGQNEARPVAVVTTLLHRSRVLRARTMRQQVDHLVARGQRCQDERGDDGDLSEETTAHIITVSRTTSLGTSARSWDGDVGRYAKWNRTAS